MALRASALLRVRNATVLRCSTAKARMKAPARKGFSSTTCGTLAWCFPRGQSDAWTDLGRMARGAEYGPGPGDDCDRHSNVPVQAQHQTRGQQRRNKGKDATGNRFRESVLQRSQVGRKPLRHTASIQHPARSHGQVLEAPEHRFPQTGEGAAAQAGVQHVAGNSRQQTTAKRTGKNRDKGRKRESVTKFSKPFR